jgi:hypothetical protein
VLNSNDSLDFHPENNSSKFTIQYDKPIEFLRDMEVGLIELSLPHKYNYTNIPNSNIHLVIEGKSKNILWKFNIEEKFVSNEVDLFNYINSYTSKSTIDDIKNRLYEVFITYGTDYYDILYLKIELPKIELRNNKIHMTKGIISLKLLNMFTQLLKLQSFDVYYEFDENLNKIINFPKVQDFTPLQVI